MEILITGGSGFLGKNIARLLTQQGHVVRIFCRGNYPDLVGNHYLTHKGDIRDYTALKKAATGVNAIIHTASKVGVWGNYEDYYQTNVTGTENVIKACQSLRIGSLVYTSTPSVVYAGHSIEGGDESLPYPDTFATAYAETKSIAERKVLQANSNTLKTIALRPHLIWGPGDNQLIPRIVEKARKKRLALVNCQNNLVDHIYVDNAAAAHCLALVSLGDNRGAGRAYFISQDEPISINTLINKILNAADLPPVTRKISPKTLYRIGYLIEGIYRVFRLQTEPPMTRFVAKQLSTCHWFKIDAAKRDLNYQPVVTLEQGLEQLKHWFSVQKRDT